jgi:hypothetical protein
VIWHSLGHHLISPGVNCPCQKIRKKWSSSLLIYLYKYQQIVFRGIVPSQGMYCIISYLFPLIFSENKSWWCKQSWDRSRALVASTWRWQLATFGRIRTRRVLTMQPSEYPEDGGGVGETGGGGGDTGNTAWQHQGGGRMC